jgi:hypothetical protein
MHQREQQKKKKEERKNAGENIDVGHDSSAYIYNYNTYELVGPCT